MSPNISRAVYNSLLPKGSLWIPKTDGGLDLFLDGISLNAEEMREFLAQLAFLRDSQLTPILDDLEKEYGLEKNDRLTEQERRDRLKSTKTSRSGYGADYMEEKLIEAGFDVQVHINNPPVDPDLFLFLPANAYFGFLTSVFGNENAIFSGIGSDDTVGELVVNGDFYEETIVQSVQFNNEFGVFGNERAVFGYEGGVEREKIEYTIPNDPGYWGLFFFVGGDATRDGTGALSAIEPADIPTSRRDEIKRLIIKYKPTHSWCGLIANFI